MSFATLVECNSRSAHHGNRRDDITVSAPSPRDLNCRDPDSDANHRIGHRERS